MSKPGILLVLGLGFIWVNPLPAPISEETPTPTPKLEPVAKPKAKHVSPTEAASEALPKESEAPEQRQLDYANMLFTRKLYDLAIPQYQKYLDDHPAGSGRANAYFSLGECDLNLNRAASARVSFQKVMNDYSESDFAGPAAYALAEMAFTKKDYATALPLFHRSAVKSKESSVALSARYFEARCLEALNRKDEARDLYQQVIDSKGPNPYRDDSRRALGF